MTLFPSLDFVVIGAQKSGTSTLDALLRANPRLHLPVGKEVPVVHEPDFGVERWASYSRRVFGGPDGRLRGKVSPQYLQSPVAAANLERWFPEATLVVVLRDPVERAASHYRMAVRRGQETRSFEVAVRDQLDSGLVPGHGAAESDAYVAWGRYGLWLGAYADALASGRLLAVWFDDLVADAAGVAGAVARHLGVEEWSIDGADRAANVSGRDGRLAAALRRARRIPGYDRLKRLVPADTRHAVAFRVDERSVRPYANGEMPSTDLPGPLVDELVALYRSDARLLADLGLAAPPWTSRWVPDTEGRRS